MTMINCKECGKEISSLAAACPSCGAPVITSDSAPVTEIKVSMGEMTSKRWKKIKLISWIVIFASLILMGSDQQTPHGLSFWAGANFIILGIIGLIIARIGSWWSHG